MRLTVVIDGREPRRLLICRMRVAEYDRLTSFASALYDGHEELRFELRREPPSFVVSVLRCDVSFNDNQPIIIPVGHENGAGLVSETQELLAQHIV